MKYFALLILIFSIPVLAYSADQVVLTNEDHYTGTITKADGTSLMLKTDSAR